jgi:hypothetical protein
MSKNERQSAGVHIRLDPFPISSELGLTVARYSLILVERSGSVINSKMILPTVPDLASSQPSLTVSNAHSTSRRKPSWSLSFAREY